MSASSIIAPSTGHSSHTLAEASKASRPRCAQCHTCRLKRLRCDGGEPGCSKCAARGVECLGYGGRPVRWVLQQSFGLPPAEIAARPEQHQERAARPAKGGAQRKKRGRPKLVLMPQHGKADERADKSIARCYELRLRCHLQRQRPKPDPSAGLDPVDYQNHRRALHSLRYYNSYMCPDLVLLDSATNPHRVALENWRCIPELIMGIIVSTSLTHQAIRCYAQQPGLASRSELNGGALGIHRHHMSLLRSPSMPIVYEYHRRTLRALQKQLDDPSTRYEGPVLSAIAVLMRVEIQQSAFGAWNAHLAAARTVIARRSGFGRLATKLLEAIIRINLARALGGESTPGVVELDAMSSRLLTSIASFDAATWTRNHLQKPFSPALADSSSEPETTKEPVPEERLRADKGEAVGTELAGAREVVHEMCQDLAKAFQYAVMLYCIRTLHVDRKRRRRRGGPGPMASQATAVIREGLVMDAESARDWALARLMDALHRLWAREEDRARGAAWCGKFSFWPLFMAGMEAGASARDRGFICHALRQLCFYLGDPSPLDAVSFLQLVWRKTAGGAGSDAREQQMSWDERLVPAGV
ncbi:fungal specific transcription factor [Hirsutella rhossiliensis]|uniref:Fungal specific transcription factor domain-containing protein n=1 Tax=Hirsutella rhossiliensis TaxID=111463 RepID=A0A9P8MTM9_9HYPO|nr:fungal specific transcription factor domain-containing protein [Hirsutella rhossiliensis]KAH0960209.1 fungal specific transcription factor domain-containing protein [Hirsutella rhossiliensis]